MCCSVSALDNKNVDVKKKILDLLSALCVYSAEGYGRVLDVLQHYKVNMLTRSMSKDLTALMTYKRALGTNHSMQGVEYVR